MQPELPPGANSAKLFEDKTPNAIILNRILLNSLHIAWHDDLVPQDGSDLIDIVVPLCQAARSSWRTSVRHGAHIHLQDLPRMTKKLVKANDATTGR
jgi:hypothetical protein